MGEAREAFQHRSVRIAGTEHELLDWGIAVEAPVEIKLNGEPWTLMLATPTHMEDLAVGLAISERLVSDAKAITSIAVVGALGEYSVDLTILPEHLDAALRQSRTLAGNSGCGLCGLESLAAFRARLDEDDYVAPNIRDISDQAIDNAFAGMPAHQTINNATRSVHAAAWCSVDGGIVDLREDVGRHNALDKLIGARARADLLGEPGFIAMSSRCSYELVYKSAAAHAFLLATISAPTTLALTWSETLGVPLACAGPGKRIVRFPPGRIHAAS